jgi:hypothetical protein
MYYTGSLPRPEEQFCRFLRDRWVERDLRTWRASKTGRTMPKRDLLLRIEILDREYGLPNTVNLFRVVRVCGGITLAALADKVLLPSMGWARGAHSWIYQRLADFACAAPLYFADEVFDEMWRDLYGYGFLDDRDVVLSDFLRHKGDVMEFHYHLSHRWVHSIRVQKVYSLSESTNVAQILDGAGACPPEDAAGFGSGLGPGVYFEMVKEGSLDCVAAAKASNYAGTITTFDPFFFDLNRARQRLKDAVASRSSWAAPTGKEDWHFAVCAGCGSPHNLRTCGACRSVRYCSKKCQNKDWKNHYSAVCLPTMRRCAGGVATPGLAKVKGT